MRCLVTGGAGFIGSHTVDALLERGHHVRILDNLSKPVHLKGKPDYLKDDAEFMLGDVRNKADWEKALDGVDTIFHFAAYQDYLPDFSTFFHINAVGTALMYEVAVEKKLDIQKIVVASSQAVYGEGKYRCARCNRIKYPGIRPQEQLARQDWEIKCDECNSTLRPMWTNENRVNPQNQYAISKYTQEITSINLGKRYDIPTSCLRYSIVQGPRQSIYNAYSGACRIFSLSMFFDQAPPVYEDGAQQRDFVNVHDVVAANLTVMESSKADYKVFNVGGGKAYTVAEFARIVSGVFGKQIEPDINGMYRFGDTRNIFSDISHLRELGWRPHFSPKESVEEYVSWLRSMDGIENVLEEAQQKMRKLDVVRDSKQSHDTSGAKYESVSAGSRHRLKIEATH
ncbi:NAD-dependent epimerase/dehydratase family protein [candidate division KSB1 bacterium]|nr:NAD-dependent epimerase/dehydratase family protein [candidate division KSB1 bacterium]